MLDRTIAARVRSSVRSLFVLGVLGVLIAPASRAAVTVRTVETSINAGDMRLLEVDHQVGEVHVLPLAESGTRVEVVAEVRCSRFNRRCQRWAEDVSMALRPREASIALELEAARGGVFGGTMQIDLVIRMPERFELEIDLGVGRVLVDRGNRLAGLDIDLGVGDVELALPEASIGSIRFEVGVGFARIEPRDGSARRSSFVVGSNDVRWLGDGGDAVVRVDIGVGAGRATLE